MSIQVRCECGKEYSVPPNRAGKLFRCYLCNKEVLAGDVPEDVLLPFAGGNYSSPADPLPELPVSVPALRAPAAQSTPMSNTDAYRFIAERLGEGHSREVVEQQLVDEGYTRDQAAELIWKVRHAAPSSTGSAGAKDMLIGGLICLAGLVITFGSLAAASSSRGGGGYVVAYGAIIFGAIRFFKGLFQMGSGQ